jgi:hypothetical protein
LICNKGNDSEAVALYARLFLLSAQLPLCGFKLFASFLGLSSFVKKLLLQLIIRFAKCSLYA